MNDLSFWQDYKKHLAAYWKRVRQIVFQRHPQFGGKLDQYVMQPGAIWHFVEVHKAVLKSVGVLAYALVMLLAGYLTLPLVFLIVLLTPLIVLVGLPIKRYRQRRDAKLGKGG
jgi:hypothetical protein